MPACLRAVGIKKILAPHGERFTYFELLGLQDCRIPIVSDSTVGFSRNPSFFVVAAAAFLGLGFWLIRGIGFRGILGFLGF